MRSNFSRVAPAACALGQGWLATQAAPGCMARRGQAHLPVVELITSEACNSCPPADRWLWRLKAGPDAIALDFHVGCWDRPGWRDRFASPAHALRRNQQEPAHMNTVKAGENDA